MKKTVILCLALSFTLPLCGQQCDSIAASYTGGWKSAQSAPKNGTVVEMLQTYGVAPWYGLFKWTNKYHVLDSAGKSIIVASSFGWFSAEEDGKGVSEKCLFWRPYRGDIKKYIDPTSGEQRKTSYWCAAMHRGYNPKTDTCK